MKKSLIRSKKTFLYSAILVALSVTIFLACSKSQEGKENTGKYEQFEEISTKATQIILNGSVSNQKKEKSNTIVDLTKIKTSTSSSEKEFIKQIFNYSKNAAKETDAQESFNTVLKNIEATSISNKEQLIKTLYLAKGTVQGIKQRLTIGRNTTPIDLGCCYNSALYYYYYMENSCANNYTPDCADNLFYALDYLDNCMAGEGWAACIEEAEL